MNEMNFEELMADEALRQEFDRRVEQAVEGAKRELQQEIESRLALARAEGERIAGMSAEEKLRERERLVGEREKQIARRELHAAAIQLLAGRGLPAVLADALDLTDVESCERSVENIERVFRNAVQEGVTQRLGAELPPCGRAMADDRMLTDEQYYAAKLRGI